VRRIAGHDVDDVDVRVLDQLAVVLGPPAELELLTRVRQQPGVDVGQTDDLATVVPLPAGDVRAHGPASGADDSHAQGLLGHGVVSSRIR
jgi:hypothetical protein